ncbi:MAG TPA: hypothetical protein VGO37_15915 [Steroidobacteraceae bacterium]|jgi:hypothetical protein|nr:hypothetical protein [Steroidobacteraceae bacterium]
MSGKNAVVGVQAVLRLWIRRYQSNAAAPRGAAPDECDRFKTASQIAAEYWARRAMWVLVIVTSLWDIGATFDRALGLTARFLYASLPH